MTNSSPNRLPLVAALLVLAVTSWYGYSRFAMLSDIKTDVAEADEVLFELETQNGEAQKDYEDAKKQFVSMFSSNVEKLASIFPKEERLSELTRAFDEFSIKNHYKNNPFFISQLNYGKVDSVKGANYSTLPIDLQIETSEKNFFKFLEYIETSGSIENGIRLMSVNGISLQLGGTQDKTLRVHLNLLAYLQHS